MRQTTKVARHALLGVILALLGTSQALADSREEIETKTRFALERLNEHSSDMGDLISKASGVLVFPDVVDMTFGEGGRYGEGALLIDGEAAAYYATTGLPHKVPESEGTRAEIILFMTREALIKFRNTIDWKVGVSSGMTKVHVDDRGRLETTPHSPPVLGLTFTNAGLQRQLDLGGTRINRIGR